MSLGIDTKENPIFYDVINKKLVTYGDGNPEYKCDNFPHEYVKSAYDKYMFSDEEDFAKNSMHFPGGYLIPAIGHGDWDGHIYISGATGAGKSYFINALLANDKRKRRAYIFTDFENDDPSLETMYFTDRLKRVSRNPKTNKECSENEVAQDMRNSILIFDDCSDKEHIYFRDQALKKGRKKNVVVVCVEHAIRNWRATKAPLTESRYFVVFPSASKAMISSFLKEKLSLNNKVSGALMKASIEDGRHSLMHMFHPNLYATSSSIVRL